MTSTRSNNLVALVVPLKTTGCSELPNFDPPLIQIACSNPYRSGLSSKVEMLNAHGTRAQDPTKTCMKSGRDTVYAGVMVFSPVRTRPMQYY